MKGTWEVNKSPECETVIEQALEIGYTHIDTAFIYHNEKLIGNTLEQVFKNGMIKRDDLFITSKLPPTKVHSEEMIRECFMESLENLKIAHLDW